MCLLFLITKDVLAACGMLAFLLTIFRVLRDGIFGKKELAAVSLLGIVVGLLRNDGKYIILGSIVLMLFLLKEYRKRLLVSGIVIATALSLFFNVLMPALHITPTSKREMLSVPFQQTARYFRDYPNEVTPEEYAVISAVLDAETIGKMYNPTKSDAVKATYRESATREDLMRYFNVWYRMGLKHPGVYVQAILNNYYNYFYPGPELAMLYSYNWSATCMKPFENDEDMQKLGSFFFYPQSLGGIRTDYEEVREGIFELPVLSLLKSPAAYVWWLVLLILYLIKEKAWEGLALTVPLVLSAGVCFLGPRNGDYFRYLYGVYVCLPVVTVQALWLCERERGAVWIK